MLGNFGLSMKCLPRSGKGQGEIDIDQTERMVDKFLNAGFTYIDASFAQDIEASEDAVRLALTSRRDRDSYTLASAFPTASFPPEELADDIINIQLKKTGARYFDYYFLSGLNRYLYDGEVKLARLFEHMKAWRESGLIRHIGISFHDSADILEKILIEHPEIEYVQLCCNYYDWEEQLIQSHKCFDMARRHFRKVIVTEPLKNGLLATVPQETLELMHQYHHAYTPASYALRFAADMDGVAACVTSPANMEQLEDDMLHMTDFQALGYNDEKLVIQAKYGIMKSWKYRCKLWSVLDSNELHIPISGIIRAYNSVLIQPDPSRALELYYYKPFAAGLGEAFETADFSYLNEKIKDAFDVNAALREADAYLKEHSLTPYYPDGQQ